VFTIVAPYTFLNPNKNANKNNKEKRDFEEVLFIRFLCNLNSWCSKDTMWRF